MTTEQIIRTAGTVLWILFAISVLFNIVRFGIHEYRRYKISKAPVFTARATAHCKHPEMDAPYLGRGYSYVYYITFHTEFGEAHKLYMTRDDFYIINEGDTGELTWQGEKFWKFMPEKK